MLGLVVTQGMPWCKAEVFCEQLPDRFCRRDSGGKHAIIPVPAMGEAITVSAWHKNVGDQVEMEEVLCEVETDTVTLEIRAPDSGVIQELYAKPGDTVLVGQNLIKVLKGATGGNVSAGKGAPTSPKHTKDATPPLPQSVLVGGVASILCVSVEKPPGAKGTAAATPKTQAAAPPSSAGKATTSATKAKPNGERLDRRVPMTSMRKRVAERLKASQNTAAMLTTYNEIDMTSIMIMRNLYKEDLEKKHGVKLGFLSIVANAAIKSLQKIPIVNAVIDGDDIVYREYIDMSVAVSSAIGLVVLMLRNVHNMTFADIESAIALYGNKAATGTFALEDMAGGTFTISNGGVFGSMMSMLIVNQPHSAILGMYATVKRPHVVGDKIEIRPIMYVALTYDHRIIDSREAVTFLKSIKQKVEDPRRLLLGL